jgi:hypothetical protein
MAGVAGPMLQRSRVRTAHFLTGLAVGGVSAGLVLTIPVYLAGQLAGRLLPVPARAGLVVGLSLVFGLADLFGRTPHVWRQVPQQFVRMLPPGILGLTWGFDLGLLVTTQKTSSLLWLSIAAVALLDPALAPAALVGFSLVATAAVVILSVTAWKVVGEGKLGWAWIRRTRRVTGATMLATGLGMILVSAIG